VCYLGLSVVILGGSSDDRARLEGPGRNPGKREVSGMLDHRESGKERRPNLADILQDHDDESQIANVEGGKREADVAEVTSAVLEGLVARSAVGGSARGSQARI
jgi:hypothetical protein